MAWVIDRDYGADADPDPIESRVGVGQWGSNTPRDEPKPEMPYRFRCVDDDGEVHYGGRYDKAAVDEDEEWGGLYQANKWAEADSGALWLHVKLDQYVEACGLDPEGEHVTRYMRPSTDKDGWYSVYA